MRSMLVSVVVLSSTLLASVRAAEDAETEAVVVPAGSAVIIDGTLADDEWESARRLELGGATELLLQSDGAQLHVGVRNSAQSIQSIAIFHDDRVRILHASASLGTAVYERVDGHWDPIQEFAWACRRRSDDEKARSERAAHLEEHGWVGTIAGMGEPDESELTISHSLLGEGARLAVVSLEMGRGGMRVVTWPEAVGDGSTEMKLLMGNTPASLSFAPEDWGVLAIGEAPPDYVALVAAAEIQMAKDPVAAWRLLAEPLLVAGDEPGRDEAVRLRDRIAKSPALASEVNALEAYVDTMAWIDEHAASIAKSAARRDRAAEKLRRLAKKHANTLASALAERRVNSLPTFDER